MNYALSLLSFEIYQDSDINGLFKLTSIQIGNRAGGNTLQYTGTMDIVTGNIKGTPGAYKATLLTIDPSVTFTTRESGGAKYPYSPYLLSYPGKRS